MSTGTGPNRSVFVALVLVAFNLRLPLTSVPTVITDIHATTGYGEAALGALTTLPILAMGALAFVVPGMASRFGPTSVVWFAVGLLAIASSLRLGGAIPGVMPLTALLAGCAIALAGGCVPGIVRDQLPHRIGLVTSVWTAAMLGGAGLGAALTVPLSHWLGTWQKALAFWAIPAAIAWVVWTLVERRAGVGATHVRSSTSFRDLPWRDPVAWSLTLFMSVNAVVFYSALAWLAPAFEFHGITQSDAGFLLGVFTAVGLIAALYFPAQLQRTRYPRGILVVLILLSVVAFVAVAIAPTAKPIIWVICLGVSLSGLFTMGLALISMLSADGRAAARLTAMVFAVTYLVAAVGPVSAGALLQLTGSWTALFLTLAVISLLPLLTVAPLRRGATAGERVKV